MANRLGDVIYWLCSAIGGAFVLGGLWAASQQSAEKQLVVLGILAGLGIGIYIFGRAVRYILSGI